MSSSISSYINLWKWHSLPLLWSYITTTIFLCECAWIVQKWTYMLPTCDDNIRSTFMVVVMALYQHIICRTNIMFKLSLFCSALLWLWNYWTCLWCTYMTTCNTHLALRLVFMSIGIPNHELYICHSDMDILECLMLQMPYRLGLLLCSGNPILIFFPHHRIINYGTYIQMEMLKVY